MVLDFFVEQLGRHHRREREGDDAGNHDRAGEGKGKLTEERAGEATLQTDRRVHGGQRDRHGDDGPDQFACAEDGGIEGRLALAHVALDVFDNDDGVVHHETDGEHDGQQRQQVDGEPENLHQEHRADERHGDRDHGHQYGTEGAKEEKDHDDDDQERLQQGADDFVDGVVDVLGGVVGHAAVEAGGQFLLDLLKLGAGTFDDFDRVGGGQHEDAHEDRGLAGEAHLGVVVVGTEDDVGDVFEADDGVVLFADDELLELIGGAQVGVGG